MKFQRFFFGDSVNLIVCGEYGVRGSRLVIYHIVLNYSLRDGFYEIPKIFIFWFYLV